MPHSGKHWLPYSDINPLKSLSCYRSNLGVLILLQESHFCLTVPIFPMLQVSTFPLHHPPVVCQCYLHQLKLSTLISIFFSLQAYIDLGVISQHLIWLCWVNDNSYFRAILAICILVSLIRY